VFLTLNLPYIIASGQGRAVPRKKFLGFPAGRDQRENAKTRRTEKAWPLKHLNNLGKREAGVFKRP
jgi:hypothetical protein